MSFQWISPRSLLFSCLLVLCFLALFFTYKPDITYPNFTTYLDKGRQICPDFLCANRQNSTQKIQAGAVDSDPDTIVLIWMWPLGYKFDLSCDTFNIPKCHLTYDKSLYPKAHGVLFHHRDIHGDLKDVQKMPRPHFQKWVWFNMESPAHSGPISGLNDLFNLTCNYRLDSSIPVTYGSLVPVEPGDQKFTLPAKDKLVCWIVSNWNPGHRRVQFYNELKKHVNINAYGAAFGKHTSDKDFWKIMPTCKFYLSFENSIYKDYITEKLYNPLIKGTVPVVLGPPRVNYEDHVPADSFIHVDDFPNAKELAERLLYLDKNKSEYMKYFDWTSRFKVKKTYFGRDHACETCKYLQKHREKQTIHNLNKWYWG